MNFGFKHLNEIETFKVVGMEKSSPGQKYCFKNINIPIIISLSICIYIILFLFFILRMKNSSNNKITKLGKDYKINDFINENTYFKIVQEFIDINTQDTFIYDNKQFKKTSSPKISIITTVHNGEAFIKNSIRSVQNQDLHDIEILIVEDMSEDNTLKIIKELREEDPRIILLENDRNRGILYSIIKGVLNAKGKYIIILDADDFLAAENALSIIYEECEKDKLDMLGFGATQGNLDMETYKYTHTSFHNYLQTSIIYQPELSERAYDKNKNGQITEVHDMLWGYLIKKDVFIKAIKEIDEKYLKIKNIFIGDYLLFFIITKLAKSLKYIKKFLYVAIKNKISKNPAVKFYFEDKINHLNKYRCQNYLSYIDFVYTKSNNNFKLASFAFEKYFLNNECKRELSIRSEVIRLCKLFLENQFIEKALKEKINNYFAKEVNESN